MSDCHSSTPTASSVSTDLPPAKPQIVRKDAVKTPSTGGLPTNFSSEPVEGHFPLSAPFGRI